MAKPIITDSAVTVAEQLRSRGVRNFIPIGIVGRAGAGKSTLATTLVEALTNPEFYMPRVIRVPADVRWHLFVQRTSFATPLKEFLHSALGIELFAPLPAGSPFAVHQGDKLDVVYKDKTARALLQTMGTEVCRQIDPNFWIDSLVHRVCKRAQAHLTIARQTSLRESVGTYIVVIDDVRFMNEADWIMGHPKGMLIDAVNVDVTLRAARESWRKHPSEQEYERILSLHRTSLHTFDWKESEAAHLQRLLKHITRLAQ